jgi:predicted amidohydrolase
VDFFIDTAETYHSHFLLFPELFTCNMFSAFEPGLSDTDAMNRLADMTPQYIEMLAERAKKSNLFIIGGSTPVRRDGKLYNVAHIFTPSGAVHTQDKLHITPAEREFWDFQPGEEVKVFDTPYGRIGVLVCYDIEFPELSRLMTLKGVEVLFVPFSTDERKAFNRVRVCSQARAVENYIYTVLAGNVGNLPSVRSYLINYGQAAVYTPSDFAFPLEGTAALADPNAETVVIADLDLSALKMMREIGSVRPLYDRRPDLYELSAPRPVKVVMID